MRPVGFGFKKYLAVFKNLVQKASDCVLLIYVRRVFYLWNRDKLNLQYAMPFVARCGF